MYESPLSEAHRRVIDRQLEHRLRHAARAGEVRGDEVDRSAATSSAEVETVAWGMVSDGSEPACEVVLDYGELEGEYAAIRRGVALMDRPDRAVVRVSGSDAVDLVDRLVTNKVAPEAGVVEAFVLDRKGRILADALLVATADRVLMDVDRTDVKAVVAILEEFVFAEDVEIADLSETHHRIDCVGPDAPATIEHLLGKPVIGGGVVDVETEAGTDTAFALDPGGASTVGEPGIGLLLERVRAEDAWERMIASPAPGRRPVRPIGWNAYNIARIENGSPIFHLDFGPDSLPHETGLVDRRVDFRKGCYPGQEVVARMESRAGGVGKRRVVGIRPDGDALPVAGAQVFDAERGLEDQVGSVTSSTISPMRGAAPIALATLRSSHVAPGTRVTVNAEGEVAAAMVTGLDLEPPAEEAS